MAARPDPREPLKRLLATHTLNDAEMRVLLRDSAREAAAIVSHYGDGIGSKVRQAQLDVSRSQQQMWKAVGYQTQIGVGDGADAASESMSLLMDTYMGNAGISAEYLRMAILQQGRNGIDSLLARGAAGIPLSQQVYKTSVQSGQQLDRVLNALIVNGASAREIATRVKGFVDPATPGGSSYAAMRLGRTELNNAFHQTSSTHYQQNPFVDGVAWRLSGSHPKADQCDDYANSEHYPGGEPGVYLPDDVPEKPHPQCFCFLEPTVTPEDEFVRSFKAGKYDNYLDGELGCYRG